MALRQRQANLPFEVATEVEPTSDREEPKRDVIRSEFPSNLVVYAVILPLAIVFMILVIYLRPSGETTTPIKSFQYISTTKQKSVKDVYILGGAISVNDQQQLTSEIEKYDVAFDKLTSSALLRTPRYHHASVAMQENFYILGGSINPNNNENGMTASVEKYDVSSDMRSTVPNMRRRRYGHSAIVFEHSVYVVGGETDDTADTSMEIYDAPSNKWADAAPMSRKRVHAAAVLVGPCIYVMGGHAGMPYSATDTMEKYDIFRKTWVPMAPMNVKRFGHASVVVSNRYIYVFGGRDENDKTLDSVERFDVTTNSWALIESMPTKRAFFAAAIVEPYIALVGGHNGIKLENSISKYDLNSRRYKVGATLPQPTMGLSVTVF